VGDWPPAPDTGGRIVALCDVTGPGALVLGSAQSEDGVDPGAVKARGLEIVRRSGGGGAVVVVPGGQVWAEIWLPRADPLWDDDIVAGAQWVGRAWAGALASLGARDLGIHSGRATRTAWSDTVCFAGVGPGEVVAGGRKVVGLSQRRTRAGVRFHTVALARWHPDLIGALVVPAAAPLRQARRRLEELARAATGLDAVLEGTTDGAPDVVRAVEDALLSAMP